MKIILALTLASFIPSILYAQDGVKIIRDISITTQKKEIRHSIPPIEQVSGNNVFDLMPKNMIEMLGKVDKDEFEIYTGEPIGYEDNFIIYEVESSYEKIPIAIRCDFHKETGKLIHVHFPTPSRLGYELGFIHLTEYKKRGNHKVYKDQFNQTYRADYKYKGFGMQVFYDGVVSYHIVK